ncbi:MAG: glycoside hydrolase family 3 C-terminal domain-containing protein [Acidobacteriia bacterium]|nr:glycoside hydrolase family 3 C-terminal domain-containing protein [Terriglobia bacterium]
MLLAPTVNINRIPVWGRNFEGFGEDPYLTGRIAVGYIKGLQAEGIIPSVKHFAVNNQEYERHRVDVQIDDRTLNEIYLPAFKAAVQEAGAWSVMSAYNKVNGDWCAENPLLLTETLQKAWGFKGFVISDWGSTYRTEATAGSGMNLEMPGGPMLAKFLAIPMVHDAGFMGGYLVKDKVMAALNSGKLQQAAVDDSVRRMLRVMFTTGLFDKPKPGGGEVDTPAQRAVARQGATESIVLLKNASDLLPLAAGKTKSVAVIGPNAAEARPGGGGSSKVDSQYKVAPLDGIKESAGAQVQVGYALGVTMEGQDKNETPAARKQKIDEAVALAKKSDVAVVFVGYSPELESEDFDRKSVDLPAGQDDLIGAVAAANPRTVVVVVAGGPVTMTKWIGKTPAVLMQFYGGQEAGHAIADVLFGAANPSGKLPVTFPKQLSDSPAAANYPGGKDYKLTYAEGIYVGYRGFDKKKTEPLFPFGHGLSYTKFEYSNLQVTPKVEMGKAAEVTVQLRNSGSHEGAEVVQVYLRDVQSSVDRPLKELKAFKRVNLKPGETQSATFTLDQSAMSFYDAAKKTWIAEPGSFEVWVGSSSSDIRLKGTFQLLQ